jgi:hypothetical protein
VSKAPHAESLGSLVLCSIRRSTLTPYPRRVTLNRKSMSHTATILILVVLAGCAPRVTSSAVQAPNPNGCYVFVYENPDFSGARSVFNGPRRFRTFTPPTRRGLPSAHEAVWSGPAAMADARCREMA